MKINPLLTHGLCRKKTKKVFRIMKLSFFIMFVCVCQLFAVNGEAQNAVITLKSNQLSIGELFKEIEKQTDYLVVYSSNELNANQVLSLKNKKAKVSDYLDEALGESNMKYKFTNNYIILSNAEKPQADQQSKKQIKGVVLDQAGETIIGANVVEKGTTNGTVSDVDGNFILTVSDKSILLISYIGYNSRELAVKDKSSFRIVLDEDSQALSEVVVIGYGTTNRQAITGSVAKANLDKYKTVPVNNVLEAVKGTLPGLNISGTNKAGEAASFSIRGTNSTRDGGNNPLVVIDGAIYDGSLADIPSADIESFTVLKDASAAAVYGSRSANGVILIQTKRGRSATNKPEFNVNLSYGISNELARLEVYDRDGYLNRMLDVRRANGLEAIRENLPLYLEAEEKTNYEATPDHRPTLGDPYELFRQNAYSLKANVSISNSSEFASYYISADLTDQKGVVMNDAYKNFSGRINIDSNLTSWLKIGLKTNYSLRDYSGAIPMMERAVALSPYASIYDDKGQYRQYPQTTTSAESPYWSMASSDVEMYNNLNAVLDAKITIPWVKGLSYSLVYSNGLRWQNKYNFYNEFTTAGQGKNGKGERELMQKYNMLLDNLLKYSNTFANKHNVDVTLLYSRERRTWEDTKGYAEDFDNTILNHNKLENGKKQTATTGAGESGAIGMMARATYTYDGRYSLTGTVRRDGYSAFSVNKKWGTFSSVGVNWNLSSESFLKNVDVINNLSVRASYGSNGNQSIDPYSTLATVGSSKYIFAGDPSYSIGQYISSFALDNLGWETTTGFNFGLDFSVLNDRLSGSIDGYSTNTTDLLFKLALPFTSGKKEMLSNIGEIKNKGVEINLHSINIQNKTFSWSSDFAFSLNRNKVATIYGDDNDGDGKEDDLVSSGYFIGKPLGTVYNYKVEGIWQQSDVDNGTIMTGMRPGDYKLQDVDGDGKISSDKDRQFLGTTAPNFRWSLTNTLTYKDLSLLIYINSTWGGNGYFLSGTNKPYADPYVNSPNLNRTVYDYWTPENTGSKYPRPDYQQNATYKGTQYMDRSYIKLQKLAINYNLSRFVKPIGINNMNLSLSADNLFTFAPHWDGLDPETDAGLTITSLPSIRTYQMTLLFNF